MAESTAAERYAQAMIEIAAEADAVERIGEDLDGLVGLLRQHDGLLGGALASPVFTVEERRKVIDAVLAKLDLHPLTKNLLQLVNDKGRMGLLGDIVEAYRDRADQRAGRVRVIVQTAEPMSNALEKEVQQALAQQTGKTVVLETQVLPELIGGMVARVGGKVYDSSLRTRLEQIKSALLQGSTPAQA